MSGLRPSLVTLEQWGADALDAAQGSGDGTNAQHVTGNPSSSTVLPVATDSTSGPSLLETPATSPLKVYSPTRTEDWLKCPIFAQFRRRLQPREPVWSPARTLGKAVQVGVNVWLQSLRYPSPSGLLVVEPNDVEMAAQRVVEADFQPQEAHTIAGLTKLATGGALAVIESGLFDGHYILLVDEPVGSGRPDVVSRLNRRLQVADFKVALSLRDDYRAKRLAEYDTHDQFWQYAWEVGEHFGEQVERVRAILVILAPLKVLHADLTVTPERVDFWLSGARQTWRDMDAEARGERPCVPKTSSCYGKYGKCDAFDFCYVFRRDPAQAVMSGYYEERVRG